MHITFWLGCVRRATSGFLAGQNVCGTYEHKQIVTNLVDLLQLGCQRIRMNAALAETPIDHACVAVIQLQDIIKVRV